MHIDVVLFLHRLKDPAVSRRRLRSLLWKIESNSFGPRKVPNRELRHALDAIKQHRPGLLTKAELASLYNAVR